jgi:hypothetical protein
MRITKSIFCKRCKVCTKPIRPNNKSGLCSSCGNEKRWKGETKNANDTGGK